MEQVLQYLNWDWFWPKLLWILNPLFFLIRVLLTILLFIKNRTIQFFVWIWVRLFYDRQISNKAKCPGCGIRNTHPVEFSHDYNKMIHHCNSCKAEWGEDPIIAAEKWVIAIEPKGK